MRVVESVDIVQKARRSEKTATTTTPANEVVNPGAPLQINVAPREGAGWPPAQPVAEGVACKMLSSMPLVVAFSEVQVFPTKARYVK